MKTRIKAVLLSGLLFPGLGQVLLRRPVRAALFLLPSLAALSWLLRQVLALAAALQAELAQGTLAPEPLQLMARVQASGIDAGANGAALVLLLCWLASIADALWPQPGR